MTAKYVLTPGAYRDLQRISDYTLERWGSRQRRRYLAALFEAFDGLTGELEAGRARPEVRDGLWSIPVAEHVVFYSRKAGQVVVLRVLHRRQDPDRAFRRTEQ